MTPTIDWSMLLPALAPLTALLTVLVVDAIQPRSHPDGTERPGGIGPSATAAVGLTLGAIAAVVGALSGETRQTVCVGPTASTTQGAPACLWDASPLVSTGQAAVLLASVAVIALISVHTVTVIEIVLILAAAIGGVAVIAARDIGTWLITIELATIPVIALIAWRLRPRAAHAALTLLTTSLVSFGLLVLGVALWLVATGSPAFTGPALEQTWADPTRRPALALSAAALICGLAFKLSAVPFHAWTPPALTGAPLPVAALLTTASKVAAVGALIVALSPWAELAARPQPSLLPPQLVLAVLAIASILCGTVLALRQQDVVRLLAWSTIAQAGWIILPLTALTATAARVSMTYAITYAVASLVAFAAVRAVHGPRADNARGLAAYTGLFRRDPLVAGALAFALLVLAGLPPGVIGLVVKVAAFGPVLDAGLWPLAVIAAVAVVVGVAVYLRWIAVMLAVPASKESAPARPMRRRASVAIAVGGAGVLALASVWPQLMTGAIW